MSLWGGIDLGSLKPATAIVDMSPARPRLVALHAPVYTPKRHGDISRRLRRWQRELTEFLRQYQGQLLGVGIEYSSGVYAGKSERGRSSQRSNQSSMMARYAAEYACAECQFPTDTFAPTTLGSTLGIGRIYMLSEDARRKERKRRSIRAAQMLVSGTPDDIDDNAADAIAAALTMSLKKRYR